jgi:hypothetical protein
MTKTEEALIKTPLVKQEIERYKWLESEKAEYDIGMERASREWLSHYAEAWLRNHSNQSRSSLRRKKS